jgi:hypothetical protein
MIASPKTIMHRLLAVVAFLGMGWPMLAQRRIEEVEPQWLRFRPSGASVGVHAEADIEETTYGGGVSDKYERWFIGPLIGLAAEGSVYHPNLLQYDLSADGAIGWSHEKATTSLGTSWTRSDLEYLGNFAGNAIVLDQKPYRGHLFVNRSHTIRDYDFFNRVTVDSLRYGVRSGYTEGPVPFRMTLARHEEDTSGLGFDRTFDETLFQFDARNERETGTSTVRYSLNDFERSLGADEWSGVEHSFGVSDTETFGTKFLEWRNEFGYSQRELTSGPIDSFPNDALSGSSHLLWQHRPNLASDYNAHYLRNDSDEVVAENMDASAGVRHRLFSSLSSGLRFQALRYTTEAAGGDFTSDQYIGTWSEAYTKRIGRSTQLSVGGSLGYSHTDQESSAVIAVIGEAHSFNAGAPPDSFFLNFLRAHQSTIQVFDQSRSIRYTRDVDYSVVTSGERTIIRLIQPNPSGLTTASQVIVDYDADSAGSGSIDGQLSDAQIRVDFLDGMVGVYARYSNADYKGSRGIVVEDVTSLAFGSDFARRWFRAGIEYQIYEATFTSYEALRLYQTIAFNTSDAGAFSLTLTEGTVDYKSADRTEEYYSAIGRYHHRLTSRWSADVEAGVSQRFGRDVDQFLAAVRPSVSYNVGQLSVKLGYEFEYQEIQTSEERWKHMLTFRARRYF